MKTPRALLWERHADAEADLNALRRRVVDEIAPVERTGWWPAVWLELVWKPRLVWSGLAAAWLFILGGNAVLLLPVSEKPRSAVNVAEALRQQRALYAEFGLLPEKELLGDRRRPGPQSRFWHSRSKIHVA